MSKLKLAVPTINEQDEVWGVDFAEKVSACDNRPGLTKMYVEVVDKAGRVLPGVKVRFDTEPVKGHIYEHPNWWGVTTDKGLAVWDHLGVPTRYRLYMGDDPYPLIVNIRTDLGNEYCRPEGSRFPGWRPVNRPGVYSYRFKIRRMY